MSGQVRDRLLETIAAAEKKLAELQAAQGRVFHLLDEANDLISQFSEDTQFRVPVRLIDTFLTAQTWGDTTIKGNFRTQAVAHMGLEDTLAMEAALTEIIQLLENYLKDNHK